MQADSDLLVEAAARLMPRLELECHGKRAVFLGGKSGLMTPNESPLSTRCLMHSQLQAS